MRFARGCTGICHPDAKILMPHTGKEVPLIVDICDKQIKSRPKQVFK